MIRYLTIFFILLVGFIIFNVKSGYEREINKLIHDRDSAIQRMNNEHARAEEWRHRAFEYGNAFRAEATRAQKAETRFNYLREENERLKKRPVIKYNEPQLDSIFNRY